MARWFARLIFAAALTLVAGLAQAQTSTSERCKTPEGLSSLILEQIAAAPAGSLKDEDFQRLGIELQQMCGSEQIVSPAPLVFQLCNPLPAPYVTFCQADIECVASWNGECSIGGPAIIPSAFNVQACRVDYRIAPQSRGKGLRVTVAPIAYVDKNGDQADRFNGFEIYASAEGAGTILDQKSSKIVVTDFRIVGVPRDLDFAERKRLGCTFRELPPATTHEPGAPVDKPVRSFKKCEHGSAYGKTDNYYRVTIVNPGKVGNLNKVQVILRDPFYLNNPEIFTDTVPLPPGGVWTKEYPPRHTLPGHGLPKWSCSIFLL